MSDWGSILTQVEAEIRQALADLPAGTLGFERGLRIGQDLTTEELPHVFAHNPEERITELDYGQRRVEFSIQLDVWVRGETQEQLAVRLDDIRNEIDGNRTLSGTVDKAFISSRGIREFPGRLEKAGVLILQTEKDL